MIQLDIAARQFTILGHTFLPTDTLLEAQVRAFRQSVEAYPTTTGPQVPAVAEEYARTAYALYQKTIAPLRTLTPLPETLIVVPDGMLSYLPFEALLCELPAHFQYFKTHHYLLRDFQISYANSATQLTELLAEGRIQVRPIGGRSAICPVRPARRFCSDIADRRRIARRRNTCISTPHRRPRRGGDSGPW